MYTIFVVSEVLIALPK